MKFIKFEDGSAVRSDTITAVRLGDASSLSPGLKPPGPRLRDRVIVDFVAGNHCNSIVLDCETAEERNVLAGLIMAEIEAANRAASPQPPAAAHRDDEAVDRFAEAMKRKMAAARDKGRSGWNDRAECTDELLATMLVQHLTKANAGTFEDVANFCMMLHRRGADAIVLADACRQMIAASQKPPAGAADVPKLRALTMRIRWAAGNNNPETHLEWADEIEAALTGKEKVEQLGEQT